MDNSNTLNDEENAALERLSQSEDWRVVLRPWLTRVRGDFQDTLSAPKTPTQVARAYPDDVIRGFISGIGTIIGRVDAAGRTRQTREAATRTENQRDEMRDLQQKLGRTSPVSPGPHDAVKRAAGE